MPVNQLSAIVLAFVMLSAAIFLAAEMAPESETTGPTTEYCEMTEIHEETEGEYGWPDYKNIADDCAWKQE